MWTATLKVIDKRSGQLYMMVEFANGTVTIQQDFLLSAAQNLKQLINAKIAQLDGLDTFAKQLAIGVIDMTPDAAPTQTQAEIDQQQFLVDYNKWQRVKKAIDAGILTGNETPVLNLKAKVQAEFKPAYLDLL